MSTTSPPTLAPDRTAAAAFLRAVRSSGFHVLVAIDPEQSGKIETRSFAAREAAEAAEWAEARNADGLNLYWTVNSVQRPLAKKPSREDVSTMDFLHVDVDPDKKQPLGAERDRIRSLFLSHLPNGVPQPSIVIDSGGGYQGFWRLEVPFVVDGQAALYDDAARYNQQLEVLFAADACHNVDRIMRLPGTVNWPGERKRAAGREPRLATLVSISDARHPLSSFVPAPRVQAAGDAAFAAPARPVATGNVARLLSLDELPATVPGAVKVVINQGHDPDNPNRWPSRSEPLFWVCCELVRQGVPDDVVYSVITDPDFRISESVLEKGARAEKYALQQIAHAHEHCTHPSLAELNRRHAVIADLGGRCRVIAESWDPVLERDHFSVQTFEDFTNRYSNRFVEVASEQGSRATPLGRWWISNPLRRQYNRMLFAPGKEVPGDYNLWRGFACEAVPGDCSLYLAHVRNNICRGDEGIYEYVLSWMARAVQFPGQQAHTAVVLRGTRGVGKGVFATGFGELFGRHFFPITNPTQIFGQFNEHLLDTVVVFADEAFFAGDKRNEAVLKGLVTENRRVTEAKYRAAEITTNCLHVIMAANDEWVVPAGSHERRFLVLQVSDDRLQNRGYFGAIGKQMAAGGREALLHMLLSRDVSAFDARDVPRTAALQEQKEHSLGLEEGWWYDKLRDGEVRDGAKWPEWVACSEVAYDFSQYALQWGRGRRASLQRLGRLLERLGAKKKQLGKRVEVLDETGEQRRVDRPRVWHIPPLDEARAAWAKMMGGDFEWGVLEELVDRTPEEPYA